MLQNILLYIENIHYISSRIITVGLKYMYIAHLSKFNVSLLLII